MLEPLRDIGVPERQKDQLYGGFEKPIKTQALDESGGRRGKKKQIEYTKIQKNITLLMNIYALS
jgi:hypothetical protein